eukprot:GEMP01028304.1.p1 GENE.GEMP01028304.1~~GEMP01028304.1.p1  ORF type:complete len:354 (+),score=68.82 GEMP01028304.1:302-1363(+)
MSRSALFAPQQEAARARSNRSEDGRSSVLSARDDHASASSSLTTSSHSTCERGTYLRHTHAVITAQKTMPSACPPFPCPSALYHKSLPRESNTETVNATPLNNPSQDDDYLSPFTHSAPTSGSSASSFSRSRGHNAAAKATATPTVGENDAYRETVLFMWDENDNLLAPSSHLQRFGDYGSVPSRPPPTPCTAKANTKHVRTTVRMSLDRQRFVKDWGGVASVVWWALLACDLWVGLVVAYCAIWTKNCECDQPLWWYLAVGWVLLSGLATAVVDKVVMVASVRLAIKWEAVFTWISFVWLLHGYRWVSKANRCGATSPVLFWTAWVAISVQWHFMYLCLMLSIVFIVLSYLR